MTSNSIDGELTRRLTHPRFVHEKEYRVLVDRIPEHDELARWRRGVRLPSRARSGPASVELEAAGGEPWLRVILRQGRKRQIRETAAALDLQVLRLIRVRIASLRLDQLRPGDWRVLKKSEIIELQFEIEAS